MSRVRWEGDNLPAISRLVANYGTVRYDDLARSSLLIVAKEFAKEGSVEVLREVGIPVNLGDIIHVKLGTDGISDGIGIERPPNVGDDGEITWTGENPFDVAMFVRKHELSVSMNGRELILKESAAAKQAQGPHEAARRAAGVLAGSDNYVRMRVGDKLLLNGGKLFLSRAGKDHRA